MILVIGGTGFVGKNLVVSLYARGMPIRAVSRDPDKAFLEAHAPGTDAITLEKFMSDPQAALFDVQTVVYLASTSTPGSNLNTPWQEARNTVEAAMRVLSAVSNNSQANVIYLSSGGAIYGETLETIAEDCPLHPISPYGLGKRMTEAAIDFMACSHGLQATILRPSNPIGRWQVSISQGVVGALMRAAKQDSVFPMIGEGTAVRDYFDVRDLAKAIENVIDNPDKCHGKIWNVGSGVGVSVRQMLDLVEEVSGRKIKVEHLPARPTDVARVVLDTSAIKGAIGWAPKYDLRTSLRDIWAST